MRLQREANIAEAEDRGYIAIIYSWFRRAELLEAKAVAGYISLHFWFRPGEGGGTASTTSGESSRGGGDVLLYSRRQFRL